MKSSIAYAFALVATGFVAAQIGDMPSCAYSCALSNLPDGCSLTDYGCFCKSDTWLKTLVPCVQGACNDAEQQQVLAAAQTLCAQYSVTISSDILASSTAAPSSTGSSSNSTASITATGSVTATGSAAAQTSNNAAVPGQVGLVGSGLMAAAAGVAMFVL